MTKVAIACLIVGTVLMVVFEATLTRVLGVLLLFGFVVAGVFAIADPANLAETEEDS